MLVAVVLLVAVSVWKVEGFQQRNRIVHDYCFRDALHPLKRTPTILQVVQFDEDTNDLKITPLTTTREPGSISRRVAVTGLATNIGGLFLPGVNLAFAEDDQNSPVEEEPNSLAEWTDVVGAEETEEEESTTKEPIEYVIRDFTVLLPNHWEVTKSYDNGEENGGEFSTPTLFSATDFTTGSTLTVVEEEACELDQDNNSNKCDFIESEGASPIFSEESFEKDVSKLLRRHDDRNSAVLKGVSTLDTINLDGRISNFATDLDSSLTSATYYETSLTVLDLKATTSYQDGMGLDQPSDSDRKVLAKAVATTTTITRTKEERSSNLSIKEEDDVEVAEETSEIIGSDQNEEELEPLVSSDSSFRDATEPSNEPTISDDISDSNVESIADASSIDNDPFSSDVEESVETSESKLTSMMSLLASILTEETEETDSLETSEAESTVVVEEERKLEENTPSNEETEEIVPSETIADNASDSILEEPTQALSEEEPKTETDEIAEAILSSQDNGDNADDATEEVGGDNADDATEQVGGDIADDATEQVGGDIADDAMEQVVGDNADDVTEEVGGDIADDATEQFRQDNTEDSMAAFGQDNAEDSTAKVDESKEKPSETPSPDMETAAPPEQTSKVMTTATTSKIISIWLSAPMDEWDREGSKLQSIWEGIRYTNISKESPNNEKESKDDDDALNSQLLLMNRSVLPR